LCSAGDEEEGSSKKKKKNKGGKKKTGLKGLIKLMHKFLSSHRTEIDVKDELERLALEEELSASESIQFALQSLFNFEGSDQD